MTNETDLSTADLAQPGGPQQSDRSERDAQTGERAYETTGNRVVDPADQETVRMPGGVPGTGSTRDDARPAVAEPGRGGSDVDDRGTADRGTADRGMSDRAMADREEAGQDRGDRAGSDRDTGATGGDVALLDPQDAEEMRRRWSDTQARFVDDPREAVQTADGLVAELMQTLARSFSAHKGELEAHWQSGGDPDTEQLRQALQRYRSFFDRLLSA